MAEIITNDDLENNKKKNSALQGTAGPVAPSVQATVNPAQQNKPQVSQQKGSGFTNLQQIMSASNPNKLNQAVTGGVQKQVQQTQQGIQQSQQQFQQGLQQGSKQTPEDQARIQRVMSDPTSATQEDYAAFDKYRAQAYTGPTNLQNVDQLRNQTQQVGALASLTGSQGGKEALLQRFVGGTGYTPGQSKLDSALLGSSVNQGLRQQAREASALQRILEQQSGAAQAQAQQATSEVDKRRQDLLNNLESKEQALGVDLRNKLESYNKLGEQTYNDYLGQLQQGNVDRNIAEMLGISGGRTFGIDPTKFLQQGKAATLQQFATPEDYARAQALAKLSGQQTSDIGLNDPSLAGTAGPQVSFDKTGYLNAIDQAKRQYTNQLASGLANLGISSSGGSWYDMSPEQLEQNAQTISSLMSGGIQGPGFSSSGNVDNPYTQALKELLNRYSGSLNIK